VNYEYVVVGILVVAIVRIMFEYSKYRIAIGKLNKHSEK
jgi:hypothetical protein